MEAVPQGSLGAKVTLEQIVKDLPAWGQAGPPSWVSVSLQPGSVFGAVLSQKPSRFICQRGTSVTIQCQADSQLTFMYWYRQLPGQSLTLIATANQGSDATYESGFKKDKFPISRPNLMFSILTVSSTGPEDSSSYFCSAGDTVLGRDQISEQEPQLPPPSSLLPVLSSPAPIQMSPNTQAGGRKPQLWGRDSCWCVWWVGVNVNGRTCRTSWNAPFTDRKSGYWEPEAKIPSRRVFRNAQ